MSLSDLASLGSFVSGFAVLISLIFLYFQLRQLSEQGQQAERNQKALIQVERAGRSSSNLRFMASPEIVEVYSRGRSGASDLTPSEYQQYYLILRANLVSQEDTFFQHQQNLIGDASVESARAVLGRVFSYPGNRAMWRRMRMSFEKSFRDFIDQMLNEAECVHPSFLEEEIATWHKDVAAELATARKAG
jgi:hypothetical protein